MGCCTSGIDTINPFEMVVDMVEIEKRDDGRHTRVVDMTCIWSLNGISGHQLLESSKVTKVVRVRKLLCAVDVSPCVLGPTRVCFRNERGTQSTTRQRVPTVIGTPYVGFFFYWLHFVTSYTDRKITIASDHRLVSSEC